VGGVEGVREGGWEMLGARGRVWSFGGW
jgi:hypothetical protein